MTLLCHNAMASSTERYGTSGADISLIATTSTLLGGQGTVELALEQHARQELIQFPWCLLQGLVSRSTAKHTMATRLGLNNFLRSDIPTECSCLSLCRDSPNQVTSVDGVEGEYYGWVVDRKSFTRC